VRNNLKVEFDLRKAKTEIDSTDKKRREGEEGSGGPARYELQITRSNEVNKNQNFFEKNAFFLFLENSGF
jgi:hypothetical protein